MYHIYLSTPPPSISLSLSIYIYIYMYMYIHLCIDILAYYVEMRPSYNRVLHLITVCFDVLYWDKLIQENIAKQQKYTKKGYARKFKVSYIQFTFYVFDMSYKEHTGKYTKPEEETHGRSNVDDRDAPDILNGIFELMHRYMKYNKRELKTYLRWMDLTCSGSKADMVLRILKAKRVEGIFGNFGQCISSGVSDCCVCLGVMVPPIISCRNGHSTCNDCATRLNKCPTCRVDMKIVFRNHTAEGIFANSIIVCPYGGGQCESVPYYQFEKHREICPFVYRCYSGDCNFVSTKQAIMENHLKIEHELTQVQVSMRLMREDGLFVNITTTKADPVWLKCGKDSFFIFQRKVYGGSITVVKCVILRRDVVDAPTITLKHGLYYYQNQPIPFNNIYTEFEPGLVLVSRKLINAPCIHLKLQSKLPNM